MRNAALKDLSQLHALRDLISMFSLAVRLHEIVSPLITRVKARTASTWQQLFVSTWRLRFNDLLDLTSQHFGFGYSSCQLGCEWEKEDCGWETVID